MHGEQLTPCSRVPPIRGNGRVRWVRQRCDDHGDYVGAENALTRPQMIGLGSSGRPWSRSRQASLGRGATPESGSSTLGGLRALVRRTLAWSPWTAALPPQSRDCDEHVLPLERRPPPVPPHDDLGRLADQDQASYDAHPGGIEGFGPESNDLADLKGLGRCGSRHTAPPIARRPRACGKTRCCVNRRSSYVFLRTPPVVRATRAQPV
jgi:hypothetical protein